VTLATDLACDALAALFTGVAAVPQVVRNDRRLTGFIPSGVDGISFKFVMNDEAPRILAMVMGDPSYWELQCFATFVFMVEGEAGAARDGVFRAGLEAIAQTLFPDGRGVVVDGAFEDLNYETGERDHYLTDPARPPVETYEFTVSLTVTAATPFG
jgi:hypothetical protein